MKTQYPLIYIEWCDTITGSKSWVDVNDVIEWAESRNWVIKQTGFLIKETKKYILIGNQINEQEGGGCLVSNATKIPTTWILKRKTISF